MRRWLTVGLRWTLLLSLLPLLTLPWIGLRFVDRMAELARDERLENQAGAARALAASLHERADLFETRRDADRLPAGAQPLPIEVLASASADGRIDDWSGVPRRPLGVKIEGNAPPYTLKVRFAAARAQEMPGRLFLLVEADDERFVAPTPGQGDAAAASDDLIVEAGPSVEQLTRLPVSLIERDGGWFAELAIDGEPRLLRIRVTDVDYLGTRRIEARADSGLLVPARPLSAQAAARSDAIWEGTLRALQRAAGRVSVFDANGALRAQRGELGEPLQPATGWRAHLARALLAAAVSTQPEFAGDSMTDPANPSGSLLSPLARALAGAPVQQSQRVGMSGGMPAWVLTSAQPIWLGDRIVGALVLEENTASRLALGQTALEQLTLLAALAVSASVLVLLLVASITVGRVVRLRDEAESAIDGHGRVVAAIKPSALADELGDLRSSYAGVLQRLREYQEYLGKLRSRLAHELRTPIMVVRSSLENLAAAQDAAQREACIGRVQTGAARLERIVASMSEATSLETMLADSELERVDLVKLLDACTDGYRGAFAPRAFELVCDRTTAMCRVVPEAIAQALDKLVSNAVDFAAAGSTITLLCGVDPVDPAAAARDARSADWRIAVRNRGPSLPANMGASLFDQMVSVRGERASEQSHLGLGLYLVRLIAEFHGGHAFAHNVQGGVEVGFTLRNV